MSLLFKTLYGIKRSLGISGAIAPSHHSFNPPPNIFCPTTFSIHGHGFFHAASTVALFGILRSSEVTCSGTFGTRIHLIRSDVSFYPDCYDLITSKKLLKVSNGPLPGDSQVHYSEITLTSIGAATTAGAVGLSDWLIKVLGRWKSYRPYTRYSTKPGLSSLLRYYFTSSVTVENTSMSR